MSSFRSDQNRREVRDLLRMWPTLIIAAITFALVWRVAPQQVGILVYTLCKLSMAAYFGYFVDRWVFPDSRPSAPDPDCVADDPTAAEYRRAGLIAAFVIASGLLS